MGFRHTLACAAAVLMLSGASTEPAFSDDTATPTADRATNRDFLALSRAEQRRWINGFMVGTSNALALRDVEVGRCVARWYFDDEETVFEQLLSGLAAYSDERPVSVIFAYARRACPNLAVTEG